MPPDDLDRFQRSAGSSQDKTTPLTDYRIVKPSLLDRKGARLLLTALILLGMALLILPIKWMELRSGEATDDGFKLIALPVKTSPPSPVPDVAIKSPPLPSVITTQNQPVMVELRTMAPIDFPRPKVDVSEAIDAALSKLPTSGLGTSETLASSRESMSTEKAGGLLGSQITSTARIALIFDKSGSMQNFDQVAETAIRDSYTNTKTYSSPNAIGGALPAAEVNPPYAGAWFDKLNAGGELSRTETGDLYGTIYKVLRDSPEVVVLISDFEDGYLPKATSELVNSLRESNTKLVILSSKKAAYPGLPEYCQESGGSYQFVQILPGSASKLTHTPDPKLPDSLPISDVYDLVQRQHIFVGWDPNAEGNEVGNRSGARLVAREFQLLQVADPKLRQLPSYQGEQDYRNDFARQLIQFCVERDDPDIAILLNATLLRLIAETRPNTSRPYNPEAFEFGKQVILVGLRTQSPKLLNVVPDLIRNEVAFLAASPSQGSTNADDVVLTCDQFVDNLNNVSTKLSSGMLQAASATRHSANPAAQKASRYLRFVLGDRSGLDEYLAEVEKVTNGSLEDRVLRHIEFPKEANGDRLQYLIQNQTRFAFDDKKLCWIFSESPTDSVGEQK